MYIFHKGGSGKWRWGRNPKWNPLFAWNCEPSAWIQERNFSLDFGWWVFQGKHENGRGMLEIVWTCFEQMDQLSYWTTKVVPWHVLMASFSCFPMMVQHSQVGEIWAPIHGPFTLWEVLSRNGRSFSRIFTGIHACFAPIPPLVLRAGKQTSIVFCSLLCILWKYTHVLYVSGMFRSLLLIFCFILSFCYVCVWFRSLLSFFM